MASLSAFQLASGRCYLGGRRLAFLQAVYGPNLVGGRINGISALQA